MVERPFAHLKDQELMAVFAGLSEQLSTETFFNKKFGIVGGDIVSDLTTRLRLCLDEIDSRFVEESS